VVLELIIKLPLHRVLFLLPVTGPGENSYPQKMGITSSQVLSFFKINNRASFGV
jgi:hypothetical protein